MSKEYGFRYNHFLERVIDEVKEHIGNNIRDYHSLSIPPHNLRSIQNVSSDHGFETKQVNTYLAHRDLQDLIVGYVPTAIKELLTIRIDDDSINRIISESISKVIKDPEALKDNKHKYDVIPLFISIKQ